MGEPLTRTVLAGSSAAESSAPEGSTPERSSAATQLLALLLVAGEDDVSRVRRAVAQHAEALGFSAFDRTRLVTAASELVRNMLRYGGGGQAHIERVDLRGHVMIRLRFNDTGPGIADLSLAQSDGFSTGRGLGLGLGGARRLVDDFRIESSPGAGTQITIERRRPAGGSA